MTGPPRGHADDDHVARRVRPRSGGATLPASWCVVVLGVALLTAGVTGGLGADGLAPDLLSTLARAAADAAAVVAAGAALAAVLAPGRVPGADRVLLGAAAGWTIALLCEAFARGAIVAGVDLTEVRPVDVLSFLTGPAAGTGLVLSACAAVLLVGCAAGRPAAAGQGVGPPLLVLALVIGGAAASTVEGHAAASANAEFAVPGVLLHVAAALLWTGGLGAMLVLSPDAATLHVALPRFSRLAGGCVVVLVGSAVLASTARLSSPVELVTTAYGGLLTAKALLFAGATALGGLTRRRLHAGRLPVLAWAGVEILLLAAAVGVAATLTSTA